MAGSTAGHDGKGRAPGQAAGTARQSAVSRVAGGWPARWPAMTGGGVPDRGFIHEGSAPPVATDPGPRAYSDLPMISRMISFDPP